MINVEHITTNGTEATPWHHQEPEYALVASVLRKAVQDAVHKPTKRQRIHRYCGHYTNPTNTNQALRWIFSEDSAPFSCRWCCEIVGIDIEILRDAIENRPASVWRAINDKQWGER